MSFKFGRVDRSRLVELLEGTDSSFVIRELEVCVHQYRHSKDLTSSVTPVPRKKTLAPELTNLRSAAKRLANTIDCSSDYLKERYVVPKVKLLGDIVDLKAFLLILRFMEKDTGDDDPVMQQTGGVKRDRHIHWLNFNVAHLLDLYGVTLTRSEKGKFAQILNIVREAVDKSLATNCFDEICKAIDALEDWRKPPVRINLLRS